jgi:hypothetical protein
MCMPASCSSASPAAAQALHKTQSGNVCGCSSCHSTLRCHLLLLLLLLAVITLIIITAAAAAVSR